MAMSPNPKQSIRRAWGCKRPCRIRVSGGVEAGKGDPTGDPIRRLTTDFFREFSDSFALNTADGQVFRSGSDLTLRSRGGGCAVRRAAAPFGVEHPFGRIRHADDEHPEVDQRNHHRQAGCFLTAVRGGRGGEDAGRFPSIAPESQRLAVESISAFMAAVMLP